MQATWSERAQSVVNKTCHQFCAERGVRAAFLVRNEDVLHFRFLDNLTGEQEEELRARLRAAYPFGPRKHHPYKMWLKVIRRTIGKAPVKTRRERDDRALLPGVEA